MTAAADPLRRRALARRKITHDRLDPTHPKGGAKARYFEAFGFRRGEPHLLAYALLDHPATGRIRGTTVDPRGQLFEVTDRLTTPDGRDPTIIGVWIVRDFGAAEFVTADPA